ncbi:hypothetical protein CAEBREN_12061 [Caenorhabditis brenneri]|uniref:DNA-directed DNA polymerase n=1 Tax=Caenorhabditis brenneri TaxID=135651 RepID=G0NY70_CAEBE|nr:hypothetical protein CAEBREN_12061 [Caenorhabditis brenneri]
MAYNAAEVIILSSDSEESQDGDQPLPVLPAGGERPATPEMVRAASAPPEYGAEEGEVGNTPPPPNLLLPIPRLGVKPREETGSVTPIPDGQRPASSDGQQSGSEATPRKSPPVTYTVRSWHGPTYFPRKRCLDSNMSVTTTWRLKKPNLGNDQVTDKDYVPSKIVIDFNNDDDEEPMEVEEPVAKEEEREEEEEEEEEEYDDEDDEYEEDEEDEDEETEQEDEDEEESEDESETLDDESSEYDSDDSDEGEESSNDEKDSADGDEEDKSSNDGDEEDESSNDEKDSADGDEEDKSSNDGDEEDESSNNEEEEEEESAVIKGEEDEQVSEDSDEDELLQYGAGKPIPPPEIEAFVPNMTFPTAQEVEYLNNYTIYQDAVHERINNRLVVLKNNCIKLRRLDKIRGMTLEEHVEKIFDIFIRKMIQQARGTLEKTKFWARLRHLGPSVEEFHVNHCTYTKGNGHVLMNNVSKRMQSGKEIAFDEQLEFSMFIFKEQDTAGRGGHTINDRIKRILRLDRQFVQTDGFCLPTSIAIGRCKSDMLSNLKNAEEKSAAKLMYRRLTRVGVKTSINQYREAKTLLRECGLDENTSTHDADDLKIIARHLKDYQIAVWHFDPHHQNVVIRDHFNVGAPGFIGLYFENNHYEFFVPHTGPESLMTTFCHRCCTLINHQKPEYNNHSRNCRAVCPRCGWATCVPGGQIRVCPDCEVTFFSDTCFQYHTEKRSASAFPHCKKYRYCKQCCSSVTRTEYSGLEHECGKGYCVVCRSLQSSNHDCCHAPPDAKEREKALLKQLRWRFFIYDIETITRSESAVPDGPPTKNEPEHVPNLICGRFICNECVGNEECRYCGPIVKFSYKFEKTEGTTIEQFIRFLQTDVRLANTTLLAHNGGG